MRKDFHFKQAHYLCDAGGMVFMEDLDYRTSAKGMFGKHMLDSEAVASLRASAVFGQFRTIVKYVCWKRLGHSGMETACADDHRGLMKVSLGKCRNPLSIALP
jgi:hypothetical protein